VESVSSFPWNTQMRGLCALSGVPLRFDAASGTPVKGGPGCHPLYAALDHVDPGN
jgi:hypothetical protein